MGQDRLSALAMLHVYYVHKIDFVEVVDKFSKKHPRRMQVDSVLLHWLWYTGIIHVLGLTVVPPIYSPFNGLAVFTSGQFEWLQCNVM